MNAESIDAVGKTNTSDPKRSPAESTLPRASTAGRDDPPAVQCKATISIVVPCFNEAEALPLLAVRLDALAEQLRADYDVEFIVVDDGSNDGTWLRTREWADRSPRLQGVRLSRNFGQQAAITSGQNAQSARPSSPLTRCYGSPPMRSSPATSNWRNVCSSPR